MSEHQEKYQNLLNKISSVNCFDLTGKTALITGASRGIGQAVAELYAAFGAKVIISSRNMENIQPVVDAINAAGGRAQGISCHIGYTESIQAMMTEIKESYGKLDILVNNAATNPYYGPVLDTEESAVNKTIDVNIKGYFLMSQIAGQYMKETGGGVIVNTASINGVSPGPLQGIYSITKAAIISMTETFAKECAAYNIRVNAVLPGLTDTKFASALTKNEKLLQTYLPMIPMNRMAQPAEIAPAFLFLASDASSYITGVSIPVDGGYLI